MHEASSPLRRSVCERDHPLDRRNNALRVGINQFGKLVSQADQRVTLTLRRLEPVDKYNGGQ
jgi:hypothetical protein